MAKSKKKRIIYKLSVLINNVSSLKPLGKISCALEKNTLKPGKEDV